MKTNANNLAGSRLSLILAAVACLAISPYVQAQPTGRAPAVSPRQIQAAPKAIAPAVQGRSIEATPRTSQPADTITAPARKLGGSPLPERVPAEGISVFPSDEESDTSSSAGGTRRKVRPSEAPAVTVAPDSGSPGTSGKRDRKKGRFETEDRTKDEVRYTSCTGCDRIGTDGKCTPVKIICPPGYTVNQQTCMCEKKADGTITGSICSKDNDCPRDYVCGKEGLCTPIAQVAPPPVLTECGPCARISDGVCKPVEIRCYPGYLVNEQTCMCWRGEGTLNEGSICDKDNNCPLTYTCINGLCAPPPPDYCGPCDRKGPGGSCTKVTIECFPHETPDYVTCRCNHAGVALFPRCQGDDGSEIGCPLGTVCQKHLCMPTCVDHTQCENNFHCLHGTCFPNCYADYKCPTGHSCQNGKCVAKTNCGPCAHEYADGTCTEWPQKCVGVVGTMDLKPDSTCTCATKECYGFTRSHLCPACDTDEDCPKNWKCLAGIESTGFSGTGRCDCGNAAWLEDCNTKQPVK